MISTSYEDINKLLVDLLIRMQSVLHDNLVGLSLYGSLVSGDFDHDISDIDLLAVIDKDLNEQEFSALKKMHSDFTSQYPKWKDRIEVAYLSLEGLKHFKNKRSKIAIISPGEPLNIKDAGNDWLINWHNIQEKGISLFGPNRLTVIPHITSDEYKNSIKEQALFWLQRIKSYNDESSPGSLAYVVFTMCRILYSYNKNEQTSKKKAAACLVQTYPQWKSLIDQATAWRKTQWDKVQNKDETALSKVREFVNFVTGQMLV